MTCANINSIAFELGEKALTNEELFDQNPSWDIDRSTARSGVKSRPIAKPQTTSLELGFRASKNLLGDTLGADKNIDTLIFCTQTPDFQLPPNSTLLHGMLGLSSSVMAFDITHACSGYPYLLGIAKSLILGGGANKVLLITADTYSKLIHPQDRSVRPLFGDAASATLVTRDEYKFEIMDVAYGTEGKYYDRFVIKNGGMRNPLRENRSHITSNGSLVSTDHIQMNGLALVGFFGKVVPEIIEGLLKKNNLRLEDVSKFVFHQASQLVLEGLAKSMRIPAEKMIFDLEFHGNLVSSSIPVALHRLINNMENIKKNDWIILCGFGVGLSWGAVLLRV